jgi:hypothetical protein
MKSLTPVLLGVTTATTAAEPAGPTTLPSFMVLDLDQSEGISRAEATRLPALVDQLDQMDRNADASISLDECAERRARGNRYDGAKGSRPALAVKALFVRRPHKHVRQTPVRELTFFALY